MAELTHSEGRTAASRKGRGNFLTKIASIAANTFVESVRQPVFAIIVAVAVALIAFSPMFTMFTLMNAEKFIADMGLATILLAGLLLGAFSASKVISEEIENKTVLTVISKPVGRTEFIFGKYVGIAAALTMAAYVLSLILVLTVGAGAPESTEQEIRWVVVIGIVVAFLVTAIIAALANYFGDRPFPSSAMTAAVPIFTITFFIFMFAKVKASDVSKPMTVDFQLIFAAVMVLWALLVMAALAVAASTRLHVVPNIVLCSAVFLVGLFSQYMFGRFAAKHWAARIAYAIVPDLQTFWAAEALAAESPVTLQYVGVAGSYAFFYIGGLLLLAMALFQERQVS